MGFGNQLAQREHFLVVLRIPLAMFAQQVAQFEGIRGEMLRQTLLEQRWPYPLESLLILVGILPVYHFRTRHVVRHVVFLCNSVNQAVEQVFRLAFQSFNVLVYMLHIE